MKHIWSNFLYGIEKSATWVAIFLIWVGILAILFFAGVGICNTTFGDWKVTF